MAKYIKINELITYGDDYCEYDDHDGDCLFNETWKDIIIKGISIVNELEYYDIVVGDEFKREDIVYLVYVSYETGSSFERHHGQHAYVNIFKDKDKAWKLVEMIEKAAEVEKYNFEYETDSGKTITCCCSQWTGHFESVEIVNCVEMILE